MEAKIKFEQKQVNTAITLILIGLCVLLRVLPHPANFAPVAAVAIFGGALLPRYWGLGATMAAMVISDMFIGVHDLILVTWGCYALMALASHYAFKKPAISKGVMLTAGSSVFFFLVTNFAVWAQGRMYSMTLTGLGESYALALPFFRNTLLSDLFYTGLLFGLYWVSQRSAAGYMSRLNTYKS